MDRVIVYPGATPRSVDFLQAENNTLYGLAAVALAAIGAANFVDRLACTPSTGLSVNIGPGVIGSMQTMDSAGIALGGLPLDSTSLMKLGINNSATNIVLVAPTTAGQSINYLIEAQFQEADDTAVALPYYNSANPAQPFSGPGGNGTSQNTRRRQSVALQLKAGAAAVAGSQPTPGADAGWVPLWVVTVPYGTTTVSSGNIYVAPQAPFLGSKVQQNLTKLTANLTLYVTATGNDSTNNGISTNTAYATLQAALNSAYQNYNWNGFGITISLGAGTTFGTASISGLPQGYTSSSFLQITGSGSGTSLTSSGGLACINLAFGASATIANLQMQGAIGCQALSGSTLVLGAGISFGACSGARISANGGVIYLSGSYTSSGNAAQEYFVQSFGTIVATQNITVTLSGTPAYGGAFAQANTGQVEAVVTGAAITFSGAATGQRYLATNGGVIVTNGGGANFFPGSTAGSATTGYYS